MTQLAAHQAKARIETFLAGEKSMWPSSRGTRAMVAALEAAVKLFDSDEEQDPDVCLGQEQMLIALAEALPEGL